MPIVIVHGVGVRRESPGYQHSREVTERLFCEQFRDVLADPTPKFVYWGDLGAKFSWPRRRARSEEPATFAQSSTLEGAVAVLSHALLHGHTFLDPAEAAEFVIAAQSYASKNPAGTWMRKKMGDAEFVDTLAKRIGYGRVSFAEFHSGLGLIVPWLRPTLEEHIGLFFGDALSYFRGKHRDEIFDRIAEAVEAGGHDDPLILLGHSLGGVILFEFLAERGAAADLFVSVGSQISYFENLKLLSGSDSTIPNTECPRARGPSCASRWINIRDPEDILAFACGDIFDAVEDLEYDTKTNPLIAHLSYLTQQRFVRMLRQEAKLGGSIERRDRPSG